MAFDADLFRLRAFIAVVEEGGFTKAAERVGLSQPAITQSIRALETQVGQDLLERLPRGARLTEAGRVVYEAAKKIEAVADEAWETLEGMRSGESGRVTIGAGATISIIVLPEIFESFRELHPGIGLALLTGATTGIRDLVLGGSADIGIITSPLQHPDLEIRPLYEDEMVLVAGRGSSLPDEPDFADLVGCPMILFARGSGFRAFQDDIFRAHGLEPAIAMESDSMEAIKRMAAVGLGAAIIPRAVAEPELSQGQLRLLSIRGLPPMTRLTQVIRRRGRRLSPAAQSFYEHLMAAFA
jgi:DNA-binding transcriptional LysR family regulator